MYASEPRLSCLRCRPSSQAAENATWPCHNEVSEPGEYRNRNIVQEVAGNISELEWRSSTGAELSQSESCCNGNREPKCLGSPTGWCARVGKDRKVEKM